MSRSDDIINLIDAGLCRTPGIAAPIQASRCGRADCKRAPAAGHDFCDPCLSWLRGETDDPNPQPDVDTEAADDLDAWVEMYGAFG